MEKAFLALIRGERRGLGAACARALLRVLSWFFAVGVALRGLLYAVGLARSHGAGVPVISIGNLTTGGTGKTPLAILLARWLVERGEKPAVLARGYGAARDGDLNDELLLVKARVPGAPIHAGRDRVANASRAVADRCTTVVLDDGFQHRRLARDVDVVVIDATDPFGQDALLPRGLLREPVSALRRAHEVVISRADQVTPTVVAAIRDRLVAAGVTAPVSTMTIAPVKVVPVTALSSAGEPSASLAGRRVHLVSAIGNPRAFRATVESLGTNVVGEAAFSDHHAYSRDDLRRILEAAGDALVLVTEKDAVKLAPLVDPELDARLRALTVEARLEPEGALLGRIEAALVAARRKNTRDHGSRNSRVSREPTVSLAAT